MRENWCKLDCLLEKHRIAFGYSGSDTASLVFKKQPLVGVLYKNCLEKFRKTHRKHLCQSCMPTGVHTSNAGVSGHFRATIPGDPWKGFSKILRKTIQESTLQK